MKHLSLRVKGKVQGVFFRKWTVEAAQKLGLSGWVKNMPDGSVRIEAEGLEKDLKTLVSLCRRGGPPAALVKDIEEEINEDVQNLEGFGIEQ